MTVRVKICGLTTAEQVAFASAAGPAYLGFMFFPKSPRHLEVAQAAELMAGVPDGIRKVAVTVDAADAYLDEITARTGADVLQLHGEESPERVAALKARYGLPVIKVVGLAKEEDLADVVPYLGCADQIMLETKAPKGANRPGGNGVAFDWTILSGREIGAPWLLAGGLRPDNVAEAVQLTGARQVDVSSGVEDGPGQKSERKIKSFVAAAQNDGVSS